MAKATNTTPASSTKLRSTRIAKVTALLLAQHLAAKQQRYIVAVAQQQQQAQKYAAQQAIALAVAQYQTQYGTTPAVTLQGARANSATARPSAALVTVQGLAHKPCQAVHAIAAMHYPNRKAAMLACSDAGINPATASTQYAAYSKAQKALLN